MKSEVTTTQRAVFVAMRGRHENRKCNKLHKYGGGMDYARYIEDWDEKRDGRR